jgi:hypothetical protein
MKIKHRIIYYLIFFILYCALAFPIASITDFNKNLNLETTLIVGFGILNSIFAYKFLSANIIFKIIISFLISTIAIFVVGYASKMNIAPASDSYGIQTAILTNAISSIILWEIAQRIINRTR